MNSQAKQLASGERVAIRTRIRLFSYQYVPIARYFGLFSRAHQVDPPAHQPIIVVLGMHRSGTSAAVGVVEDLGFRVPGETGEVGRADNNQGTREPLALVALSDRVLQFNGGSWFQPPSPPLHYLRNHSLRRNRIVRACADGGCVLKDPRMLLLEDLWAGVTFKALGVVRNPIDVAESLMRRGVPATQKACIDLWKVYNKALLDRARKERLPVVLFDEAGFPQQVMACLEVHGYDIRGVPSFFDGATIRSNSPDWRKVISDEEAVYIYDSLAQFAVSTQRE